MADSIAFRRESVTEEGSISVPSLGGSERKLSNLISAIGALGGDGNTKALDWSPNGKFLASSERPALALPPRIFLLAVDTGQKETANLSGPGDLSPAFSARWGEPSVQPKAGSVSI